MFNRKRKRQQLQGEMSLQITSLADIFTIILVFLLKSYSLQAFEITPSAAIQLPGAVNGSSLKSAVHTLEVGVSQITFDNDTIAISSQLNNEQKSQLKAKLRSIAASEKNMSVAVLCDRTLPFKALKDILIFLASSGVQSAKLAVIKGD